MSQPSIVKPSIAKHGIASFENIQLARSSLQAVTRQLVAGT